MCPTHQISLGHHCMWFWSTCLRSLPFQMMKSEFTITRKHSRTPICECDQTHTHRIQFVCVWAHACAIACTKWQVLQIPWRSETSPSNNPLFYTDDQNPYQLSLAYIPYLSYPYNWVPKSTWLWFIVGPIVEN